MEIVRGETYDRWKADERDSSVAGFTDVETGSCRGAGTRSGLEELGAQAGEFALEETEMVFCGFVLLRLAHLIFDVFDLLSDTHVG